MALNLRSSQRRPEFTLSVRVKRAEWGRWGGREQISEEGEYGARAHTPTVRCDG
jgi:hypothetical protein